MIQNTTNVEIPPEAIEGAAKQSRLSFGLAVTAMASHDDRIVVISADTLDLIGLRSFKDRFPNRLIEIGIAEQNAMGVASGLATVGLRPFVCGYAPFITARSMELLRNDFAFFEASMAATLIGAYGVPINWH